MPTTTYYYDQKLQAHIIERVDTQDDGLCEKALFYGPNARHMAWSFGRHYYDTNIGALTPEEQAAAVAATRRDSPTSTRRNPESSMTPLSEKDVLRVAERAAYERGYRNALEQAAKTAQAAAGVLLADRDAYVMNGPAGLAAFIVSRIRSLSPNPEEGQREKLHDPEPLSYEDAFDLRARP